MKTLLLMLLISGALFSQKKIDTLVYNKDLKGDTSQTTKVKGNVSIRRNNHSLQHSVVTVTLQGDVITQKIESRYILSEIIEVSLIKKDNEYVRFTKK